MVWHANSEAQRRIGEHARRLGIGRRAFLQSLCAAATTFLTLDEAFAARGNAQQQPRLLDFLFDSVASLWASGSPTMASCRNRGGALRRHPGRADARNRHLRGSLPRSDSSML